ncbi:MAG: outer rane beta-barrel protein [Flavisolibacter sp.]|nr:outer rane beta-barrel protein [Flavisolibacter sp.]
MRKLYLLLFIVISSATYAQTFEVKGIIADTAGQPLQGVNVKLLHGKDSAVSVTNGTGAFSFSKISDKSFSITASYTGLQAFTQGFTKTNNSTVFQVTPIILAPSAGQMEGIVIKSINPVLVKEDTIQFDAAAYKVREGAPVEDVIKKLPGVTVDKDGNIEAQGKKIARVRVNGKDFFGGDVQTATQNLPADVIQNIQIIDDYGDQANLTGIKSGEPEKIININVQPNKNKGTFGNATGAVGNEGRFAGNIFANTFNAERQISLLGAVNNTNANLFNFNGGGRGGGARGANFGSDNRGGAGGGSGITLSQSVGLNFRDKWGEKLSVYGSYSFSGRSTSLTSSTFSQDFNPKNIRTTQRESMSRNSSANHRLTWNMEYAIDSMNYIKASPYFSYSESDNVSRSQSVINRANYYTLNNNNSFNNAHSPNAGGNFLFNHKFKKRGRNFSANLTLDYSDNNNDRYSNNKYRNIDSTFNPIAINDTTQIQNIGTISRNARTNVRLSYAEPLDAAKTMFLELSYDWNKSATESIRDVYDLQDSTTKTGFFNDRQSNHYNYTFITNRAGISIKGRKEKYNYSIGILSQPSVLTGTSVGKNFSTTYHNTNWVPSARFVYNFARNNSLTATVDGSAREPNFFQLQPVADSSNLNNIVIGNPDLKNEFTNRFSVQYNKFDPKAGSSLFANFSYDKTNNRIVNNRFNNAIGTGRTTSYLNTDGFYGYNGNASFTRPFSNRKYTAGINMAANFDNNISFTDGQKNHGSNWNLRPGANFRIDLENKVDLTLRGDYTIYQTTTRYAKDNTTTSSKAQTLNLGFNGKNYFGDLTFGYDFSKLINYGFSSSVNSNPAILNVYAEYRFLKAKMMTVRLQGFDLFNENTGITRTVNETTITDSRTNRLARYFLLSVNIKMAKFAGANRVRREGNPQRNEGTRAPAGQGRF